MKTTDSSISPNGSAWRPKKLSTREERRRAERDARKQAHRENEADVGASPGDVGPDEPPEA